MSQTQVLQDHQFGKMVAIMALRSISGARAGPGRAVRPQTSALPVRGRHRWNGWRDRDDFNW